MNGLARYWIGALALAATLAAGAPILDLDYSVLPEDEWPELPAGVTRAELPEGGACLQLGAGVSRYDAATAELLPETKYRLTIRARVQGAFTVEQNDRAQVESLQRWGLSESVGTLQFHDPATGALAAGGTIVFLTRDWHDYVYVFRTPPGVQRVTLRFQPRNHVTQVARLSIETADEDGVVNNNPDFRYGELSYSGWRPQRDGRLYLRPDGTCVFNSGYGGSSPAFPLQAGRRYRLTGLGDGGYLNIYYYDAEGKTIVSTFLMRFTGRQEVTASLTPPAGCVSGKIVAYSVLLEFFRVTSGTTYVAANGDDAADGLSWATAKATVGCAVTSAASGHLILVGPGEYPVAEEIIVAKELTLRGAGDPGAVHLRRASGQGRVMRVTHPGAVVSGFTLSGGSGAAADDLRGAGLYVDAGLVHSCVISNNVEATLTGIKGVGVHLAGGVVSNSVICHNSGKDSSGHGIYIEGGLLVDCTVENNNCKSDGYAARRSFHATVHLRGTGEVRHCRIVNNANGASTYTHGGGLYVDGGTLRSSLVAGNSNNGSAGSDGGGITLVSGLVENCLVVSNRYLGSDFGGGGVYQSGGAIVHCTIAFNRSSLSRVLPKSGHLDKAGGIQWAGGIVSNSIIHGNTRASGRSAIDISGPPDYAAAFFNSCSPDLADGLQGNTTADPRWVDAPNGDFSLRLDSPCRDAAGALGIARDGAGAPRAQDGSGDGLAIPDIGAFEADDVHGGLACFFAPDKREGVGGLDVTFTASVLGAEEEIVAYGWDLGNCRLEGSGLGQVVNHYAPGLYDVSLTVSNSAGATAAWTWRTCIRVGPVVAYVAPQGGNQPPFDSWEKAATTIQAALRLATASPEGATRIVVADGLYPVASSAEAIYIDRGITLASLGGPSRTILRGTTGADVYPNIEVDHSDALVEGFASERGHFGAVVSRGTLRNCILRDNSGNAAYWHDSGYGAGLRQYGGWVESCLIATNTVGGETGCQGAGVFMRGASLLRNSVIAQNVVLRNMGATGAGITLVDPLQRAVVRNCLIAGNAANGATLAVSGGGVRIHGGHLQNCTVVGNTMTGSIASAGGIGGSGGTVENTIIWDNLAGGQPGGDIATPAICSFSCSPGLTEGERGNAARTPRFVDAATGDYRLVQGSPGINAGLNQAWMAGAVDLGGRPRIASRTVDMGAFEHFPPTRTLLILK